MRKKFVLLLIVSLALSSICFAQQRETPPVTFEKLSDNLYLIKGGRGANGGVYIGDNSVLVIDSKQTEESARDVFDGIRELTDKPVKYLINTHSDGDHISGNRFIPEGVTIIAHEKCREEFFVPRGDRPSAWNNPELAPFLPSLTFSDRMDIYLGSKKIELWYFGIGHTKGDAVVYFPEEKTAFLGDQIFVGRPQLIHSYKGGNSFGHVKVLSKILYTLDAEKFCSGHADVIDRQAIRDHIDGMKKRQSRIKAMMTLGHTLDEIKSHFHENESRLVTSIFNELEH
ncbi:MAG: MBL fold metallo-hydrolase [bacterium]|nr:MBL fold metallo-hydrolase [bacterium]